MDTTEECQLTEKEAAALAHLYGARLYCGKRSGRLVLRRGDRGWWLSLGDNWMPIDSLPTVSQLRWNLNYLQQAGHGWDWGSERSYEEVQEILP